MCFVTVPNVQLNAALDFQFVLKMIFPASQ